MIPTIQYSYAEDIFKKKPSLIMRTKYILEKPQSHAIIETGSKNENQCVGMARKHKKIECYSYLYIN